ncbi:MAG TPA: competence/damage-inducible protein A [Limnochorda sp.]
MRVELVTVGTELLLGQIVDTNAATIAARLTQVGLDCYYMSTVGDNWTRLAEVLAQALGRSDVVITSGGLGPTQDDLTREVAAAVLGLPLEERPELWEQIQAYFRATGREAPEANRKQALLPKGAEPIPNPVGTAPGIWVEKNGKILICVPGVPREMERMLEDTILPRLARLAPQPLYSRVLRFTGLGESHLEAALEDLIRTQGRVTVAPYASAGEVKLRLSVRAASEAEAQALLDPVEQAILARVGGYCYSRSNEPLEVVVGRALAERGLTVGVAESCTGGLIGHRLTSVPGSSAYFLGSLVTYANSAKERILGVPAETLERHGAVSRETAAAMARGVRERLGADCGLAVTGIAGPGGATPTKPVGLVYVAAVVGERLVVEEHRFRGDRASVKDRSAQAALDLLRRALLGAEGIGGGGVERTGGQV